jgi:ArsR family transcriptional regulator
MIDKFKALSDLSRLRLLNIIFQAELCVCEIEVMLEMSQTNVSRHIAKLKSAGFMESYKDAQWTHFRIDPELQKKHTDLSNYLKDRFSKEEPFITDVKRYNNYKKRNLNCSAIREDRENVLDLIKEN